MSETKPSYIFKDVMDGVRVMRGAFPQGSAADILMQWKREGFTDADRELNSYFNADYVTGSKDALAKARKHFGLPPK